ncbi:hypothetical protein LWI29_010220 [Acer saccharum]|uniref:Uncharacterized protein n=1 Tax=Acer saccharum TaxID=4024 RepID=A0AA39RLC6_ACESA|nr:hypothetical protein LWI29_010220 [Acer saccharum]
MVGLEEYPLASLDGFRRKEAHAMILWWWLLLLQLLLLPKQLGLGLGLVLEPDLGLDMVELKKGEKGIRVTNTYLVLLKQNFLDQIDFGGDDGGEDSSPNQANLYFSPFSLLVYIICDLFCKTIWPTPLPTGVFGIHTYTVKLLERSCCLFNSGRYSDHTFASRSRRQSSVFRSSNHMVIGLAPSR